MRFLVTGSAGFSGSYLSCRLIADGHSVVGFEEMNSFYYVRMKRRHPTRGLCQVPGERRPVRDTAVLKQAADAGVPDVIVHLAAQAGVSFSLKHSEDICELESDRHVQTLRNEPCDLLVASTSSVYGGSELMPCAETHRVDSPLTL